MNESTIKFEGLREISPGQVASPAEKFTSEADKASVLFSKMSTLNPSEKKEMMEHLEEAYVAFKTLHLVDKKTANDSLSTLSEVFYMYGRGLYGGDMSSSSQIQQSALMIELYSKEVLSFNLNDFLSKSTLSDHKEAFKDTDGLSPLLEDHLSKVDLEHFVTQLTSQEGKNVFQNASILRWLGHALQNIDSKSTPEKSNIDRFDKIYGASEKLFLHAAGAAFNSEIQKDANWEVGQLIYNTGRFMHRLKNPGDDAGAVKTLEDVIPFLEKEGKTGRSQQLRAQIQNILAIEEAKEAKKKIPLEAKQAIHEKCFEKISLAVEIADETKDFDPFLHAMFYNNKASAALRCRHTNFLEIQQWVDKATSYAKEREFDHYYESIYFLTEAKLMIVQGNLERAKESLAVAEKICEKYPESSEDILKDVNKLKAKFAE